nr:uncharacterized mitochondrial protein AtMg00810-like [Tanacetum cinerariifolium]
KSASTPIDTKKPLLKDPDGEDVDVHIYRSMIGSLMYLTSSRPVIMFAVRACARFQVTLKASHLHAVKSIFRYLKGKPYLGLWYPKDSPFDLEAYSNSNYDGASLDRKSTTRGCQFIGCRLISWQCKKQTVVATLSIEAEYVAAASCSKWNEVIEKVVTYILSAGYLKPHDKWFSIHHVKSTSELASPKANGSWKKVVIIEAAIRDVLRLDDAEGVDCLPNEEIFVELAHIGYEKPSTKLTFYKAFFSSQWKFLIHTILQSMSAKRTSWNEFSSAMVSTVICLSIGRRFNFSKYIFESLVMNVDSTSKFYMYPRFIQLLIKNQLGDLSTYITKYSSLALTQKVFANMKRVEKGFSMDETPLFKVMLGVIKEEGAVEEQVPDVAVDDVAAHGADTTVQGDDVHEPSIPSPTPPTPPPQQSQDLLSTSHRIDTSEDTVMKDASNQGRMIDDLNKDDVAALMDDKEDEKKEEEVKDDQEDEPAKVQEVVDVVTIAKLITEVVTIASKTVTATSTTISAAEHKDPEEESTTIILADTKSKDKGKGIMVEEPKPLKKKQQVEMDEEYARKLHKELNKDIGWDVAIERVKQKAKEDPVIKERIEELEEEENRAIQSINETLSQKVAKRRKLNEEVEDLKRHFEIVPNEDDDVYTEATSLARKPNNFSDDFLLTTLRAMFERPNGQAHVWKNQRIVHDQAKVKSWKELESCGVHIIKFITTQLILLVERRYPLSRFTLDQMMNAVRLIVEEQSEMSLKLLRFTRQ